MAASLLLQHDHSCLAVSINLITDSLHLAVMVISIVEKIQRSFDNKSSTYVEKPLENYDVCVPNVSKYFKIVPKFLKPYANKHSLKKIWALNW